MNDQFHDRVPQIWRCSECNFDNLGSHKICQICQTPVKSWVQMFDDEKQEKRGIQCPIEKCRHMNPLEAEFCIICGKPIYEGQQQIPKPLSEKDRIANILIKCTNCSLENHVQNEKCLNCNKILKGKVLKKDVAKKPPLPKYPITKPKVMKPSITSKPTIRRECPVCRLFSRQFLRVSGCGPYGDIKYQKCDCWRKNTIIISICSFCDQKIKKEDAQTHAKTCKERSLFFDKDQNPSFERCTQLQVKAITYMHKKSQASNLNFQYMISNKVKKLGYTQTDLSNLYHYIINYAPIIVHMRVSKHFQYFAKDTHYRNLFEVYKQKDGSRVVWENRIFDRIYNNATHYERVKYGTINFTNDPKGVAACASYGPSYFLLKPHIRDRCTLTDRDSADDSASIGTFRFVNNILCKLSQQQLRAAFEGSKGKEMLSNVISTYKEIQIHGPIQFSKDIERVYVSKEEVNGNSQMLDLVKQFCQKNNLEYELFESRHHDYWRKQKIKVKDAPGRFIKEGTKEREVVAKKNSWNIQRGEFSDCQDGFLELHFRQNLDLTRNHSDQYLLTILSSCNLDSTVNSKGGLSGLVSNQTLSAGQKQLLCICRALIKHSKIVLIDEATANIDMKNDATIQKVITQQFRTCTVLTIAHRLSTLNNVDKIMVMNEGQVVEFGSPEELSTNQNGWYRSMLANDQSQLLN